MKKICSFFVVIAVVFGSCGKITFNMSGASFGNAQSCQVSFFENRAEIVNPRLSADFTDALKDKIQANSPLRLVNSDADVMFEGEITGYNVQSGQVTAQGVAARDRLTITIRVRFANELDPDLNYDRSFSRFQEYPGGTSLSSVEAELVEDIIKELIEDIFNEAFVSW